MCRVDGAEVATVYRAQVVTARKFHRCGECGREIAIGERYEYVFQVYDGCAESYHTCAHCYAAARWLVKECGGYIYSEVGDELREHAQEYRDDRAMALCRLAVGIRRRWRRFSSDALMPLPTIPYVSDSHVNG